MLSRHFARCCFRELIEPLVPYRVCAFTSSVADGLESLNRNATRHDESEHVLRATVPFGPGVRLAMHANSPASIDVEIGDLESITVEIRAQHALQRFKVDAGSDGIDVSERSMHEGQLASMKAWIPARFCGVDVSSRGGAINVQGVTEASLRAYSYGGDIDVGNIRGVEAIADTGGGSLKGTVTAQDVRINTAGGDLHLKRLVGVDVEVLAGGESSVDVCYCDNLSLDTAGADVHIGHLNCNGPSVVVQSHGGRIKVDGMDGVGSLLSQGGTIDVQITEKARSVELHSGGGKITAQLVPALAASFGIKAGGGILTSDDLHINGERGEEGTHSYLRGMKAAEVAANEASSSRSIPAIARVDIDAGAGSVALSKLSFMSAVTARLQATTSAGS